jgi:hypothetical protein
LFEGAVSIDAKPVHPSIRNKGQNLHLIKHLNLEYHSMQVSLPMRELFRLPRAGEMTAAQAWALIDVRLDKSSAMVETTEMFASAFRVCRGLDKAGQPILKLDTLALCSIRGEDPCWADVNSKQGSSLSRLTFSAHSLDREIGEVQAMIPLVIRNLGVKSFCTHAAFGPLKLPAMSALLVKRDAELLQQAKARCERIKVHSKRMLPDREQMIQHQADLAANAAVVETPYIANHITDFCNIAAMGNALVRTYYVPDSCGAVNLDTIDNKVIRPIARALTTGMRELTDQAYNICATPAMKPHLNIYAPVALGEMAAMLGLPALRNGNAAPSEKQSELSKMMDHIAPQSAAEQLTMALDSVLPRPVQVT